MAEEFENEFVENEVEQVDDDVINVQDWRDDDTSYDEGENEASVKKDHVLKVKVDKE